MRGAPTLPAATVVPAPVAEPVVDEFKPYLSRLAQLHADAEGNEGTHLAPCKQSVAQAGQTD